MIAPVTPASGDAYIALLGRSTWALVNAYHAVLHEKELRPERVIIVTEEPYAQEASVAARAIGVVPEGYGCAPALEP
ncbi:MAG: hypothetical protein PHP43_09450, partial [Methanoculleus sp.]|nr:hypothetical protein [Methanoculleus sp.]